MRVIDAETGKPFQLYMSEELERELVELAEKKNCPHEETSICKVIVRGGSVQYRHQCSRCGEFVGSPIAHSKAPPDAPSADHELQQKLEAAHSEERERIIQRHVRQQKNRDSKFWEEYKIYLRSPEWKSKRDKVLKRAGSICEGCGERAATQIHHLTYKHVFSEFLFELVAVCDNCHERAHADEIEEARLSEDAGDDGSFEPPCAACRWQSEQDLRHWCSKFELPTEDAMSLTGPCGPKQSELEPLK